MIRRILLMCGVILESPYFITVELLIFVCTSLLEVNFADAPCALFGRWLLVEINVTVVPRLQWRAVAPKCRTTLQGPAQRAVIHHTALRYCESPCECVAELTSIQTMHMQDRDFDDIGYNFLVGGDGTVYEGRGWGVVGAHAKDNNHDSVGIALLGNFNIASPSPAALSSVRQLLLSGMSQGYLDTTYILLGHRDLTATECPGERLYASLHQCKPKDF